MAELRNIMTAEQKLDMAKQLLQNFDALCKEKELLPDPEVLVLAMYAGTRLKDRQSLLVLCGGSINV